MNIDSSIIYKYQSQGVAVLRKIISNYWIKKLQIGVKKNFEKLQLIPILIITPLVFLGGSFYSIDMLPEFWQKVSLLNPVLYLVSGFRWSFFEVADVNLITSISTIFVILSGCVIAIIITFITGYKIKN